MSKVAPDEAKLIILRQIKRYKSMSTGSLASVKQLRKFVPDELVTLLLELERDGLIVNHDMTTWCMSTNLITCPCCSGVGMVRRS